jgi:hypothetical protein
MSPESVSSLETLGEVAITILGFTGLVTAVQMRGRRAFAGPIAGLTVTLFFVSGLVVFASFLPGTLYLKIATGPPSWDVAFRILLGAHVLVWLLAFPFMRQAGFLLEEIPQPDRTVGFVMIAAGISTVIVELLVVLGFLTTDLPFYYRAILVTLVLIGMGSFILVLFALDRNSEEDSSGSS